jgi:hypothetical protein
VWTGRRRSHQHKEKLLSNQIVTPLGRSIRTELLKIVPEALKQRAALAGAVELRRQEGRLDLRDFLVNRAPSFLDRLGGEVQRNGSVAVGMIEQRELKELLFSSGKSEARAWADHGRTGPGGR